MGKPGGKSNNKLSSGTAGYQGGGNFWDFNPRAVAGINPLQRTAAGWSQQLPGVGAGFANRASGLLDQLAGGGSGHFNRAINTAGSNINMPSQFGKATDMASRLEGIAGQRITGDTIASDPALAASRRNFEIYNRPMLQNAASRMGLGRSSTSANAQGLARANADVPFIQSALDREGQRKGAQMSALGTGIQTAMGQGGAALSAEQQRRGQLLQSLMGAGSQEASNLATAASGQAGLGAQAFGQGMQASQNLYNQGSDLRAQEQQRLDAPYEEQQRLWAEALNSMYGPLGMVGSMIGGSASSSQSKK